MKEGESLGRGCEGRWWIERGGWSMQGSEDWRQGCMDVGFVMLGLKQGDWGPGIRVTLGKQNRVKRGKGHLTRVLPRSLCSYLSLFLR